MERKKALQAILPTYRSADQNMFCIDCFLIKPQNFIFINRLLNFNTFGGGFISGGGLII